MSWLKKIPSTHIHPLISIHEFSNHMSYYFLSLSHLSKVECELHKNSLNNFICHLSWFKKLSPTHIHPLVSIHEFSKPYESLFLVFESFVKGWMLIEKDSLINFICHFSSHPYIHAQIQYPAYDFGLLD